MAKLPGNGYFVTDGGRYMLLRLRPGTLRLYDGATGRRRDVFVDCDPSDGAYSVFLLTCRGAYGDVAGQELLSARTGALTPLPGWTANDRVSGIGRYWAEGDTVHPGVDYNSPDYGSTLFLNWRTGERREYPSPGGNDLPRDLDAPELGESVPRQTEGKYVFYRAPFALVTSFPTGSPERLVMFEHGRRLAVLSTCRLGCLGTQRLGRGRASWAEADGVGPTCRPVRPEATPDCLRVAGYVGRGGIRASWRITGVDTECQYEGCQIQSGHTRYAVFMQVVTATKWVSNPDVGREDPQPSGWRLYAAPWPHAGGK